MTLISVILPVYKVQGYLAQCLDSLLEQRFTDFEIIAVDDCSPDNSGAILADYAARDSRITVVTLKENVGLGRARNTGLEHATGEYVWFVDSDDWLAHGAMSAVAGRLREVEPEVLVVGFDRSHWDGRVDVPASVRFLGQAPETFRVEEFPEILQVLHVAWNRVVRRDLLLQLGFRFEQGWYEDVSFTFPLLAAAERISGLRRVCVHYRQRRTGAITRTLDDRHFEIFDHWEHALALVAKYVPAERAELLRPLLFERMIWHYIVVLRNAERIRTASRKRFFARVAEHYRRFLPRERPPYPNRSTRLRTESVARDSFVAFLASEQIIRGAKLLRSVRNKARGRSMQLAKLARKVLFLGYYRLELLRPVDERLALYAAYWYRGVTCNPAAIAGRAAQLRPDVRALWVVGRGRTRSVPEGTQYVVAGTLGYYRALARARYLVNNVNWPGHVVKRRHTTHVMTHHGTPLKKMGMDQSGRPVGELRAQMRRADRWDFSVSANAHTTIAWERAYPCGYETLETGYPRNDRLVTATPEEGAAIRERLGVHPHERVVLYAPTHREWKPLGEPVLDVEALSERLGPDTVLLVRAHYFHADAGRGSVSPAGRVVDVSAYPVVEDLYLASDLLVTDYSSAMFDYAVLDRPVVVFAPDWTAYRELRGVYFDLMELPPGAVTTTLGELAEVLTTGAYASAAATAQRARFRERFCALEDGGAAERVVRRVFLGEPRS